MYKGICIGSQVHFQTIKNLSQYDLAALVSVPDIDDTMTDALASIEKSIYLSVASRGLATITSDYARENIFLYRWVDDR
jgi:hypothetical protein